MSISDYHFISRWRVEGTCEEVWDVLKDVESLRRWWPATYLDVRVLEEGDAEGIGKLVGLHTKGYLPYSLRWQFRVKESRPPHGFTLEAIGDLQGRGIWTFTQNGLFVDITYDWKVRARKPVVRALSLLLRPLLASNHQYAMRRGEESLKLELARRRARTPEEAARIPSPPAR
ncbi:MAG: SRPBCC family protein [Pyrinomonadaceae bacterium]